MENDQSKSNSTIGLGIMIGRYSPNSQQGGPGQHPVLISGTQTMTKASTPLKDTNEKKNRPEKTTKMYFTVFLRATFHKKGIEK